MRLSSTTLWRPCCGACRSERLVERDEPGEHGAHYLRCEDCGAVWDGSQLTPDEARERPRRAMPIALAL